MPMLVVRINGAVGPGLFKDIVNKAQNLTPDERAELLEGCEELASAHATGAQEGQTQAPSLEKQVNLHFVCFVEVDHHLYELDGRKAFPINHGRCTDLVDVSFFKEIVIYIIDAH